MASQEASARQTLGYLGAGGAAGTLADAVMHPVDTIRARMQVQLRGQQAHVQYRGGLHALGTIIRQEGAATLYKGFSVVLVGTGPAHGLYYAGYEVAKRYLEPEKPLDDKSPWVHLAAGMTAELAGAVAWVPMDVVKQRLQVQRHGMRVYTGPTHAVRSILAAEGVRGLYRGYVAALYTFGPMAAVYFAAYEQLRGASRSVLQVASKDDLPFASNLVSGAVAGAVSAVVTTPLDVLKTRLQVQTTDGAMGFHYRNSLDAAVTIYRTEGLRAFTQGMAVRAWWIAPGTAITIASYEYFKGLMVPPS